jgi:hypothetical protein
MGAQIRMSSQSMFPVKHWGLPEILLFLTGCFALGAIGFFLAVFVQLRTTNDISNIANVVPLTVDQKAHITQSLAAPTSTSTTAEKLKIMEALSAH